MKSEHRSRKEQGQDRAAAKQPSVRRPYGSQADEELGRPFISRDIEQKLRQSSSVPHGRASGNGDWGSGSGGARRLAEGNSNDGMFKIKAYTAATHRVNFSVWVRWGLILAACVSGLIIVLWNTTGDPLEAEAKKKKQQERLKAVGTKLAARFGRTGKGKAKPSEDEDGEQGCCFFYSSSCFCMYNIINYSWQSENL